MNLIVLSTNDQLRHRTTNMSYIMADLHTKVQDVESEKNSLITVIKLLQSDTEQSQEDKWQTVTRAGEKAKGAKRESRVLQAGRL